MKRIQVLIPAIIWLLLGATQIVYAGWVKTYGGIDREAGFEVIQTPDSNYLVLANTKTYGTDDYDIWLLKLDSLGDTLWTKTYGGANVDYGRRIEITPDSNYLIVGGTTSFGSDNDIWLLKIDDNGDTIMSRIYEFEGEEFGAYATQLADSGYVIIAERKTVDDSYYVWFIRTDANGDTLYTVSHGGGISTNCRCAQKLQWNDSIRGYILLGDIGLGSLQSLIRLDTDGSVCWSEETEMWDPRFVTEIGGGTMYYLTGTDIRYNTNEESLSFHLITGDGLTVHEDYWFNGLYDGGYWVDAFSDRTGHIITGFTETYASESSNFDLWLIGDGCNKIYGGEKDDWGSCVKETFDRGYIVLGETRSFGAGEEDLYILKTDSLGEIGVTEEPPAKHQYDWRVVNAVGREIVIRYSNSPESSTPTIVIYDALGRKVDEVRSTESHGTISWGKCYGPGVYFIKPEGNNTKAQKVILLR